MQQLTDVYFDGIDPKDAPEFTDAYIVSAKRDGVELTGDELEEVNSDAELVFQLLMDYLY